jgi:hypothetical protein
LKLKKIRPNSFTKSSIFEEEMQFKFIYTLFTIDRMVNKKKCENCRRDLDVGVDVMVAYKGVIGTRDVVPLETSMLFCSEKCHREFFDIGDLQSVPGRIP